MVLFLLNLVLKVDFQKKLVDRESLFPSNMVLWLSISQDAVWFIFLSLQLNGRIIYLNGRRFYFWLYDCTVFFRLDGQM